MTSLIIQARQIAEDVHRDQVDAAGEPYIGHLAHVAAAVARRLPDNEVAIATAWLHDSLEDQLERARAQVFALPLKVIRPVLILTKLGSDNDLDDYYKRIRSDVICLVVKLEDVRHNRDPARLARLPPDLRARLTAKYDRALRHLL